MRYTLRALMQVWGVCRGASSLENFIRFEKYKRCTKRKYFVVRVVSQLIYNIVMRKRVKLNSYEPLVRDKNMKFVTRSWYNKIFPFVTAVPINLDPPPL